LKLVQIIFLDQIQGIYPQNIMMNNEYRVINLVGFVDVGRQFSCYLYDNKTV